MEPRSTAADCQKAAGDVGGVHGAALLPATFTDVGDATARSREGPAATVLVADDDTDICELVEFHLTGAGFRVLIAEDGQRTFDLLEEHEPVLFLLDVQMPKLSGFEVCQRLRADPRYRESPVIFLTSHGQTESVVNAFRVGGTDYIRKPVIVPELLARIRTHIELARNRDALRRRAESLAEIAVVQGQQLELVRSGQEELLTRPSAFPELKLAVIYRPAHVAGGDFYEVMRLSADDFAFFLADVAGHDLSIPFITGALKALTASFLNEVLSPMESLIQLNASLRRFLSEGRFVSACYARFSRSDMVLDLISAGSPHPLFQSGGGRPVPVELRGDVLGMHDTVRFETQRLQVRPGDRLFMFTDGLTEGFHDAAGRRSSDLRGSRQVQDCLAELGPGPLAGAVEAVVARLLASCRGQIEDDVVLLGTEF